MSSPAPTILEAMTIGAHATECHHSLASALAQMDQHQLRHLPVLQNGALVGEISQRDILLWQRAHPGSKLAEPVERAMVSDPFSISPEMSVGEAARVMYQRRIGSAVVLDHGKVVGMFTTVDALRALARVTGALDRVPPT